MGNDEAVTVTRRVAAAPDAVWRLVTDVAGVGERSPEATGGRWLRGATGPAVGARFRGTNRNGWRRWSTTCTVTACEPGRRFAFSVRAYGFPVAEWDYAIEPDGDGAASVVSETWRDRRAAWFAPVGALVTGVADRRAFARQSMEVTLERLAGALDGG